MYNDKRILGIITARGGSKGVPNKNIADLEGKPLIAYTIDAATQSTLLTRCIVSTEDESIAEVAISHGAEAPFMRPQELALDTSTSIEVVQHAVNWMKENGEEYDYVMILQPTSPLRTAEDIDKSIKKIVDTNADSVMGMVEIQDFSIQKIKFIEDDVIQPLFTKEGTQSAQRDETPNAFKRNTAIYLTKTELLMQGDLFGKISRPWIMPRERSLDVNDPIDLELASFWLQRNA
jgi:CMP-N-acetylneuraminic acid synthetase